MRFTPTVGLGVSVEAGVFVVSEIPGSAVGGCCCLGSHVEEQKAQDDEGEIIRGNNKRLRYEGVYSSVRFATSRDRNTEVVCAQD